MEIGALSNDPKKLKGAAKRKASFHNLTSTTSHVSAGNGNNTAVMSFQEQHRCHQMNHVPMGGQQILQHETVGTDYANNQTMVAIQNCDISQNGMVPQINTQQHTGS